MMSSLAIGGASSRETSFHRGVDSFLRGQIIPSTIFTGTHGSSFSATADHSDSAHPRASHLSCRCVVGTKHTLHRESARIFLLSINNT